MRGFILPKMQEQRKSKILVYTVGLGCTMLAGVVIGAMIMNRAGQINNKYLSYLMESFLDGHKNGSFGMILSFAFLSCISLQILIFLFGFSSVGAPFVVLLPFLRGIYTGVVSGYLYADMGIKGVLLNALLFWLPQVLQGVAMLIFAGQALDMSIFLFASCFFEPQPGTRNRAQKHVKLFIFTSIFLFIIAIFESMLSGLLAPVLL